MSVKHERFTFVDSYGVTIHCQKWIPDGTLPGHTGPIAADPTAVNSGHEIIGVVQIAHGVGEHSDRYARFASELANAGFIVYANDHRGHGRTGLEQHGDSPKKIGKLGKGGLKAAEAAIIELTAIIRKNHPELAVAMFAHSWGSLMVQRILNRAPSLWDAVILSGSAYRTPKHMNAGHLNAEFGEKLGNEWLSREQQVWQDFADDPRTATVNIAKMFGPVDGAKLFGTPKPGLNPSVPIMLASGTKDPLNLKNGLHLLANELRRLGVRDVSLRLYQDARHELLNETNRDEFIADVMTWLTDKLQNSGMHS